MINNLISLNYFSDPSILDECGLDNQTKETLLSNIRRRLTPQAVRIRAGMLMLLQNSYKIFKWWLLFLSK